MMGLGIARATLALGLLILASGPAWTDTLKDCEHGEANLAIAACSKLIKAEPRRAEHYVRRAQAYLELGQRVEAEADFNRAVKLNPKSGNAYYGRASMHLKAGHLEAAMADVERLVKLEPRGARSFELRASILRRMGRPKEALVHIDRALEINDTETNALAYQTRAEIFQSLNRIDEAIADLRKAISLDSGLEEAQSLLEYLEASASPSIRSECIPTSRGIDPGYAELKVKVDPGPARVGEPVTVAWSINPTQGDVSRPAYLVLSLPEAVRLDGRGFFGLAPDARGPFGMKFGAGRVRAIVPLHTKFASTSGVLQVLPYAAGPLEFDWAIVGVDGCGEWSAGVGQAEPIAINAGSARLVLRDQFSNIQPSSVTRSLNGRYRALTFDETFQIIDETTGVVILQREGTAPVFSPTGRFLTVRPPIAETIDVFDLLTGRAVGRFESIETLFWSHGDSFFFVGGQRAAWLHIVRTLHGRRHDLETLSRESDQLNIDDADPEQETSWLDLVPGAAGASFTNASELWRFDLSVERGAIVAEAESESRVLIMDLGRGAADLRFKQISDVSDTFESDFGAGPLALVGWNVHGPLWLARMNDPDIATDPLNSFPLILPTGNAIEPSAGSARPSATQRPRRITTIEVGGALEASVAAVVGEKLNQLPNRRLSGFRSGKNNADMLRFQKEIAPLYSRKIARFTAKPSFQGYLTIPFPDPSPVKPPDQPAEISLMSEGRDVWRWMVADTTFWLTQTTESGRNGHQFEFSMLSANGGRSVRHVSLVDAANDFLKRQSGSDAEDTSMSMINLGDIRTGLDDGFGNFSSVGVSGERYLTIMSRPLQRIFVFDLEEWRVTCAIAHPVDGAATVSLTVHSERRHITQINRDGAIHVYSCDTGREVLTGAYIDDELVVMDRHGYFDGSDEAAAYVELTVTGLPGRHLLSQFMTQLRRPGIAKEVLHGAPATNPPVLTAPPILRTANGRFEAFDVLGLSHAQIYADGRAIRRIDASGQSLSFEMAQEELSVYGTLSAIVVNKAGIASAPIIVSGHRAASAQSGRLFVLSVGIDSYPNVPNWNLQFAATDARRIAQIVGTSKLYAKGPSIVLTEDAATAQAILSSLDSIVAQAGPSDTIVVAFAGHGVPARNRQLQLALSSTSLDRLEESSLSFDLVADRLKAARARVVLFLDVCRAGLSGRAGIASNDDAVSRLATTTGAGIIIFSASKGHQDSKEIASARGGRFSVALERVLTRERGQFDSDRNSLISLEELYRGVKSLVVRESKGEQTPWLTRNQTFGDFDLF